MKSYTLSIETAFEGGSLAILSSEGLLVGEWQGSRAISKAEDVLDQISALFVCNEISRQAVKRIVVSSGSGSSTGSKIGLAIAKGLKRSLDCRISEVSVFENLLNSVDDRKAGEYLVLISAGVERYNIQKFSLSEDGSLTNLCLPEIYNKSVILDFLDAEKTASVVIAGQFSLSELRSKSNKIIDLTANSIAANIAKITAASDNEQTLY